MKKTIALLSSLLIFAGLKAQIAPTVKKETVKPVVTKPVIPADSLKTMKIGSAGKQTVPGTADSLKAIKIVPALKQTNTLPMKENNTTTKPVVKW
jgi:hypothetical protein